MPSPDEDPCASFAEQTFVRRALDFADTPSAVLSFWFGIDHDDDDAVERGLRQGHSLLDMVGLWFSTTDSFDALCEPFRESVHAAGRGALRGPEWEACVDGQLAQLILVDQLSRTLYRRTPSAFMYDDVALKIARRLSDNLLNDGPLRGEFYLPYVAFVGVAFVHSEELADHESLMKIVDYADAHAPEHLLGWFGDMRKGGQSHTDVIERFGRYPHRNAVLGRGTTPAEQAWLDDFENLPSWAKSQMREPPK